MASRLGISMQTLGLLIVIIILAGVAAYGWTRAPGVVTQTQTITVTGVAQTTVTVTAGPTGPGILTLAAQGGAQFQ